MMETIRVKEIDGIYSCDISISKEEWLKLLKNIKMPDEYRDVLLRFYYMPEHRGSCTAVSNVMGSEGTKPIPGRTPKWEILFLDYSYVQREGLAQR